jgi:hypothetical protein
MDVATLGVVARPSRGAFPRFPLAASQGTTLQVLSSGRAKDEAAKELSSAIETNLLERDETEALLSAPGRRTASSDLTLAAPTRTVSCASSARPPDATNDRSQASDYSNSVWRTDGDVTMASETLAELTGGAVLQALVLSRAVVLPPALRAVPRVFPTLGELDLTGCRGLDEEALTELFTGLWGLRVVSLDHARTTESSRRPGLLPSMGGITSISSRHCPQVWRDSLLEELLLHCMDEDAAPGDGASLEDPRVRRCRETASMREVSPVRWRVLDLSGTVSLLDAWAASEDGKEPLDATPRQGITDWGLSVIGAVCTSLESVSLGSCIPLSAPSPRLWCTAAIDRAACPPLAGLSDDGLTALVAGPSGVRIAHLDLSGCGWLTDRGLRAVGSRCPGLRDLSIAACNVSDDGVQSLFPSGGRVTLLQVLNLTNCRKVTAASVRKTLGACKDMKALHLTRTSMGIEEVASLAASNPAVTFVYRDPAAYVNPAASQLVPGFTPPPADASFDASIRSLMGIRAPAKKGGKKGAKKKR